MMKGSVRPVSNVVGLGFKPYQSDQLTKLHEHESTNGIKSSINDVTYTSPAQIDRQAVGNNAGLPSKSDHSLELRDVNYTVKQHVGSWWKGCCFRPRQEKHILNNVSLRLSGGQLTGILGNSGSGKTSMLDVIACRSEGELRGQVNFDGKPVTMERFRQISGYVIQADRLLANLTVRDTLTYTALLKFTGNEPVKTTNDRVKNVIGEMGLNHVADSLVGGHLVRGISGGERRRVSIAVQLLQDPYLLLLDEPTTGLDSFTAHSLVSTLARLAHSMDRIILMTIHQPRSDIFTLFDCVAILCTGRVQYFGPRSELVPYFTRLGYPCPTYSNPLDHYLDLSSIDHRSAESEAETSSRVQHLHNNYIQSSLHLNIINTFTKTHTPSLSASLDGIGVDSFSIYRRFFPILAVLLRRMFVNLWRDRSGFVHRIVTFASFAFFMWIFLWRLGLDIETAIQDRTGVLFETLSAAVMIGLLNALSLFPAHRALYDREGREGLYGSEHMVVAYCIHILPFTLIASLIYAVWCYWGLGMHPEQSRFWIFYAVCVVHHYLGELIAVLIMAVLQNTQVAGSVATVMYTVFLMLGAGFIRSQANMLKPLQWLAYAIFYKYSAEILSANEYHKLKFECKPGLELACSLFDGDSYLDEAFPDSVANMVRNGGILVGFIVGNWIMLLVFYRIRGIKHLN